MVSSLKIVFSFVSVVTIMLTITILFIIRPWSKHFQTTTRETTLIVSSTEVTSSSIIRSEYSSSLNMSNEKYIRADSSSTLNCYFEAIELNVSMSGNYTIVSVSNIDTFGYIYSNKFNPTFPFLHLLSSNDDTGGNRQLKLKSFLSIGIEYILVVTTYNANVTGSYSIVITGCASIRFTRLNIKSNSTIVKSEYSSVLSTFSETFCRKTSCRNSDDDYYYYYYHNAREFYYYEDIQLNISLSGNYLFACDTGSGTDFITYAYLYNTTFDPTNPRTNLLLENTNYLDGKQCEFNIYLDSLTEYTLVITTYVNKAKGLFSVVATGPSLIHFSRLNNRNDPTYSSRLTKSHSMYCSVGIGSCPSSLYYFQAIQFNVTVSGLYSILCQSNISVSAYMYENTFDPIFPNTNFVESVSSYDSCRVGSDITLSSLTTYILVVTTKYPNVIGSFTIVVKSPTPIDFTRLDMSNHSLQMVPRFSSALTNRSQIYTRPYADLNSKYYYESIEMNVSVSGNYTIVSKSSIVLYGYLYENDFDPNSPLENLVGGSIGADEEHQFRLISSLQSLTQYILVVASYPQRQSGSFSLIFLGPSPISFARMNIKKNN